MFFFFFEKQKWNFCHIKKYLFYERKREEEKGKKIILHLNKYFNKN
jgi:hypothetical protein